jgi:hypothetical protein
MRAEDILVRWYKANWEAMRTRIGPLLMNQIWKDTWVSVGKEMGGEERDVGGAARLLVELAEKIGIHAEIVKQNEKRCAIKVKECPYHKIVQESMLEWEIRCNSIWCGAFGLGITKSVSPSLDFEVERWMPVGPIARKKREKECGWVVFESERALSLDQLRCKNEIRDETRSGQCKYYKWCPYDVGLWAGPNYPRDKLEKCRYYEPAER